MVNSSAKGWALRKQCPPFCFALVAGLDIETLHMTSYDG